MLSLLKHVSPSLVGSILHHNDYDLDLLKDSFNEAKLPLSFYDAKKTIKKLGLNYIKIDACPNDCMLYLREDEKDLQTCKHCSTSRWNPKKKQKATCKTFGLPSINKDCKDCLCVLSL